MNVSFLNKIPFAIASLMASSAIAFGAMDMDSRVTHLEDQMRQVRTGTAMGTYGAQTAPAQPMVEGHGWFIVGDVLYWQAKVGGTSYAYTDQDSNATFPIKGGIKEVDFKWNWGFRLGAGYNLQHDHWDVQLQYTYFRGNGSNSTSAGLNSSIIPLRGSSSIVSVVNGNDTFVFCTHATAQYKFEYQSLALELGRAYYVSGHVSFRPHWGLKSAWIDQSEIVRYTGGVANGSNLGLDVSTVSVKDYCDFWGMGPAVGVNSAWHLGSGFSICGNIAGAMLFGFFDVEHKENYTANTNGKIKIHGNRHAFSPTTQFQLGLRYDRYLHCDRQHIGVGLGFEAQYWWRQNQMLAIRDASPLKYGRYAADASMHGVTLDIKWDF